jgi:hypothetical protein
MCSDSPVFACLAACQSQEQRCFLTDPVGLCAGEMPDVRVCSFRNPLIRALQVVDSVTSSAGNK